MKIIGKTNLEIVNIVRSGEVFAYSVDGNYPHLYMKVDLHDEFYNSLRPLFAPEQLLHNCVVAFNIENGRREPIPKDTRVTTFPTAVLYLTEPKKENEND